MYNTCIENEKRENDMTDTRIGKTIEVKGFTCGKFEEIFRTFVIKDIINDDGFTCEIVTTCGHIIETAYDRNVRKISNNRRIMTDSIIIN